MINKRREDVTVWVKQSMFVKVSFVFKKVFLFVLKKYFNIYGWSAFKRGSFHYVKQDTNLITLRLREIINTNKGKDITKFRFIFYDSCTKRMCQMVFCRDVFVVRLISVDTVEEEMLALAQKKLELEKEVTGASTTESKELLI